MSSLQNAGEVVAAFCNERGFMSRGLGVAARRPLATARNTEYRARGERLSGRRRPAATHCCGTIAMRVIVVLPSGSANVSRS